MLKRAIIILSFIAAAGCDATAADERVTVTPTAVGTATTIQTTCGDACEQDGVLDLDLAYADDYFPQDEVVELLQYRVDYYLDGFDTRVPYFAGRMQLKLEPGAETSVSLPIAGAAQRALVRQNAGKRTIYGTAEITLAGYDWDNKQVYLEFETPVRFVAGDTATAAEPTALTSDAGQESGDAQVP